MNIFKFITVAIILSAIAAPALSNCASDRALHDCFAAIEAGVSAGEQISHHDFQQKNQRGVIYLWVNSTVANEVGEQPLKSRCVTGRRGLIKEMFSLRGQWQYAPSSDEDYVASMD